MYVCIRNPNHIRCMYVCIRNPNHIRCCGCQNHWGAVHGFADEGYVGRSLLSIASAPNKTRPCRYQHLTELGAAVESTTQVRLIVHLQQKPRNQCMCVCVGMHTMCIGRLQPINACVCVCVCVCVCADAHVLGGQSQNQLFVFGYCCHRCLTCIIMEWRDS